MAKEKVDLRKEAEVKMESLVEQHNELAGQIQEANARLGEVKQMIIEHQGYIKGLDACNKDCEVK
jgi:prefoldin subunit 5